MESEEKLIAVLRIQPSTRKKLKDLKIYRTEPYDRVILRLLEAYRYYKEQHP